MKSDGLSTDFWSTGSGDNHIYLDRGGRGTAPSVDNPQMSRVSGDSTDIVTEEG